jgi:hypothetical protein
VINSALDTDTLSDATWTREIYPAHWLISASLGISLLLIAGPTSVAIARCMRASTLMDAACWH